MSLPTLSERPIGMWPPLDFPARCPRNPVDWHAVASLVSAEFPFRMQRDNPNPESTKGSKQHSGFKSAADAVQYVKW